MLSGDVVSKVGLFIELQIQWCSKRHCKCRSAWGYGVSG